MGGVLGIHFRLGLHSTQGNKPCLFAVYTGRRPQYLLVVISTMECHKVLNVAQMGCNKHPNLFNKQHPPYLGEIKSMQICMN